ncbi:MAG: hypothetical protein AAGA58_16480 [Verrucomicrobiota bacterium]
MIQKRSKTAPQTPRDPEDTANEFIQRRYFAMDSETFQIVRFSEIRFQVLVRIAHRYLCSFVGRAGGRILKVVRRIADLTVAEKIAQDHIMEAINHRALDRNLWE